MENLTLNNWIKIKDDKTVKFLNLRDISCVEVHHKTDDVIEYIRFLLTNGTTLIWRADNDEERERIKNFVESGCYLI